MATTLEKCEKILKLFNTKNYPRKNLYPERKQHRDYKVTQESLDLSIISIKDKNHQISFDCSANKSEMKRYSLNNLIQSSLKRTPLKQNNQNYRQPKNTPDRHKNQLPFQKSQNKHLKQRSKSISSTKSLVKVSKATTFNKQNKENCAPIIKASPYRNRQQSSFSSIQSSKKSLKSSQNLFVGNQMSNKKRSINSSFRKSIKDKQNLLDFDNVENDNTSKKKIQTRLQKIMKIKVNKPKVNSTLRNYKPEKRLNCLISSKNQTRNGKSINNKFSSQSSLSKSCSKSIAREKSSLFDSVEKRKQKVREKQQRDLEQKHQRLWKLFERQRENQLKEERKRKQREEKQNARKQAKFHKLVTKELKRNQHKKELSLRKQQIFSDYLYPSY